MAATAAALRALRRLHPTSPVGRLLPSSFSGPCSAKGGGAASTLHATRRAHASSIQAPSVFCRCCSAGGDYAAGNLPAVRPARASPLQVPSLVRHYGSTKGATATTAVPACPSARVSTSPLCAPHCILFPRRRAYSDGYSSENYSSDEYPSSQEDGFMRDYCKNEVLDHLFERIEKVEAGQKQLRRCQWNVFSLLGMIVS